MPAAPAALLTLVASGAGAPAPPPVILEARLEVVREESAALSELRLRLSSAPSAIDLAGVEHRGRRLELLTAALGGEALRLESLHAVRPARAWRAVGPGALAEVVLTLRYRVLDALDAVARPQPAASLLIPVVLPQMRGGPPRGDLFRAEMPLPPGHTAWESFPSVTPERSAPGGVSLALPVVPGFVRLDSGPGPAPWHGPARLADAATLAALALLGALGAGALRREMRRRDA